MTPSQAKSILLAVSVAYRKDVADIEPSLWAQLLKDVSFELADAAVGEAIAQEKFPPTPATIIQRVRAMEAQQAQAEKIKATRRAIETAPDPQPSPSGAQVVAHVLNTLAAARKAQGGPLGRERAAELATTAVSAWLVEHPNARTSARSGEPCPNAGCACTHTGGCEGGWISHTTGQVRACPTCNPRRAQVLQAATNRRVAGHQLRDTSERGNQ